MSLRLDRASAPAVPRLSPVRWGSHTPSSATVSSHFLRVAASLQPGPHSGPRTHTPDVAFPSLLPDVKNHFCDSRDSARKGRTRLVPPGQPALPPAGGEREQLARCSHTVPPEGICVLGRWQLSTRLRFGTVPTNPPRLTRAAGHHPRGLGERARRSGTWSRAAGAQAGPASISSHVLRTTSRNF